MDDNKRSVYEILDSLEQEKREKIAEEKRRKSMQEKPEVKQNVEKPQPKEEPVKKVEKAKNTEQPQKKRVQKQYEVIKDSDRKQDEPKKKKPKKKKKRSNHFGFLSILLICIFGISILLSAIIISFGRDMLGIGGSTETVVVTIQEGSTVVDVANMLKSEGIIKNPLFFRAFSKISKTDSSFIAGEHEVRQDMAYETLINALTSDALSDENTVTVTITEGMTIPQAAEALEIEGVCDADEFIETFNAAESYGFTYEQYMPTFSNNYKFYKMEGYLFPDTYTFYKEMSPDLVAQKILKNFDSKITADMYQKMDDMDMTLDEVITLASMVEKEAGCADDMPIVASVFLNRLNDSETYPRLQSDATGTYVEETIKPHIEEINQDLFDAYDTYVCTGLPAGAICNPGIDAINAVLDPAKSDYYYFYSDMQTGETYFAETYEEHLENIEMVNEKYGITESDESNTDETDTSEDENE